MTFHVKRQVIAPSEGSLTNTTFERLGSSMFSVMPCQLITSSESPLTFGPLTRVRLLACQEEKNQIKIWIISKDLVHKFIKSRAINIKPQKHSQFQVPSLLPQKFKHHSAHHDCSMSQRLKRSIHEIILEAHLNKNLDEIYYFSVFYDFLYRYFLSYLSAT